MSEKLSWKGNREDFVPGVVEVYVVGWAVLMVVLLTVGAKNWIVATAAVYRLADIGRQVLWSVLAEPQTPAGQVDGVPKVNVKHPSRWMALSLVQVLEIVVNFAVLRSVVTIPDIIGPGIAFYESLCVTVFSPFPPNPASPQFLGPPVWLQTVQLLYSLVFFALVLPVVISSINVRVRGQQPTASHAVDPLAPAREQREERSQVKG